MHGLDPFSRPDDEIDEEEMDVDKEEEVTSSVTTPAAAPEQPEVVAVAEVPAVQTAAPEAPMAIAAYPPAAPVDLSSLAAIVAQVAVAVPPEPVLDNRSLQNLPLFQPTKAKVPTPDEVEAFWEQFMVRAGVEKVFLTTPVALDVMFTSAMKEEAAIWYLNLKKANNRIPLAGEVLKTAFFERWAPTVRTTVGEAYDQLHAGSLKQEGDSVAKFKAKFDSALLPIMHEISQPLLVRAFANGLNAELSVAVQCDDNGKEYTRLIDVYNAALGHERKIARRMLLKRPPAVLNAIQGRFSSPPAGGAGARRSGASPSPARQSPAWQSVPHRPAQNNGADRRGHGGHKTTRGFDGPSPKRSKVDPKLEGSGWFTPTGREINWYEQEGYRRNGVCFNCFDLTSKHLSENCPQPKHAFPRIVKPYPKKNP
ncbi:hypothetical protein [Giesbergeria sp.]|uniref:hypothetical protein n=1 Tax=Giesbergeria sp. TaxID=2818473 RepID=UPI0026293BE4|nr:hypothetical protein [Giesbergeria sp.]